MSEAQLLSPQTQEAQLRLLQRIQTHLKVPNDPNNLSVLTRRHKAVRKYILETANLSKNTQATYLGWIVGLLRRAKKNPKNYLEDMERVVAERDSDDEQERELLATWDEVLTLHRKLAEQKPVNFTAHRDYVLLSLYVLQAPLRNDYANVPIVSGQPDSGNYLLYPACILKLRDYKTSRTYGELDINFSQDLTRVVSEFINRYDCKWLIPNMDGTPMSENQISKRMFEIFETGMKKHIGISQLRHIYISHMRAGEMSLKKKKELASSMTHSVGMNEKYRRGV